MDMYEARAFELERSQNDRFEAEGRNANFWTLSFEETVTGMIERYRRVSKTWNPNS